MKTKKQTKIGDVTEAKRDLDRWMRLDQLAYQARNWDRKEEDPHAFDLDLQYFIYPEGK